jgi:hypothetical protein
MIKSLENYVCKLTSRDLGSRSKIRLSDLVENVVIKGDYVRRYYNFKSCPWGIDTNGGFGYICTVQYSLRTGQVGLILVDEKYQNKTLGSQMLAIVCKETSSPDVFAVSHKDNAFFNKYFGTFDKPAYPDVTGGGFAAPKIRVLNQIQNGYQ